MNLVVVYCMYSLRRELRRSFIENLENNDLQRELNWMMTRTLEIDGTVA